MIIFCYHCASLKKTLLQGIYYHYILSYFLFCCMRCEDFITGNVTRTNILYLRCM